MLSRDNSHLLGSLTSNAVFNSFRFVRIPGDLYVRRPKMIASELRAALKFQRLKSNARDFRRLKLLAPLAFRYHRGIANRSWHVAMPVIQGALRNNGDEPQ